MPSVVSIGGRRRLRLKVLPSGIGVLATVVAPGKSLYPAPFPKWGLWPALFLGVITRPHAESGFEFGLGSRRIRFEGGSTASEGAVGGLRRYERAVQRLGHARSRQRIDGAGGVAHGNPVPV